MPEYKLYYFAFRGLAEVSRQVFALAGVEYENVGLTKEEWVEFKKKTPFGRIPVLEVDGKLIAQSLTIARYIASQHGLAGKTPLEAAWADSIADEWRDFHGNFKKYWYLKIGVRQGDIEGTRVEYGIPARDKFFPLIVKQLKETGTGFLVGDSVTWVDVLIANTVDEVEENEPGLLQDYPEASFVVQHKQRVHAIPALKKWIETRPQ
ncbi:hypothetical protein PRIPAC_89830 [Pristionchus pacificus]|uniref:glutathione transferase n=1 Tax=Pristionchus pacificus TaxID=54126 RepID=A0A2A6B8A4_PRIPA|nr:hypothetical protein PRIPAC_89830 [Pristionchus pacificus]|eukprot:PDM62101.1 Glutathione S-transferase [Pristionchus pacificus]